MLDIALNSGVKSKPDLVQLIEKAGGAATVADQVGVSITTIYNWKNAWTRRRKLRISADHAVALAGVVKCDPWALVR